MKNINQKLKIVFVSPKRYSFYPLDYKGRGLGGTESTLVLLTKALAARGHNVEVYNCCYKPGKYDGVNWKPIWSFSDSDSESYDIVISLRLLETFIDFNIKSKLRAVWIHDDSLRGASILDKTNIVNLWITVSETQKNFIERDEIISPKNWFITRNAYDEELYQKDKEILKKKSQLIYCSAPDRGLEHLLRYWPRIKKENPKAVLHVTGSFALWGNSDEENQRFFEDLYKSEEVLIDVIFHKRLTKQELVILQSESELMLYPTSFDEMYCISALECMAVGTPVISTYKSAMIERVKNEVNGLLIDGEPSSQKYEDEFIEKVNRLLKNSVELNTYAANSKKAALENNFKNLAREWESEIYKRLNH